MLQVLILCFSFCGLAHSELSGNHIFIGSDGESYNLKGFSSYRRFEEKLESYFAEKVKDSYKFIFQIAQRNTSEFLSFITPERFIFLQLLYSFSMQDTVYGNLLLEVSGPYEISHPQAISRWININITFKREEIYKIVQFVAKNKANNVLNTTKSISDQLIFMDRKYSIFEHACFIGDTETVKWFLNEGYDLSNSYWNVLEVAWKKGHLNIVKILLENNFLSKAKITREQVNKTVKNQTLLHVVAKDGLIESAIKLLSLGANINAKDGDGNTPIYSALIANQLTMLRLLFNEGADIANLTDNSGETILHVATLKNNVDAVALLLDLGAPVDRKNTEGLTALYKAVANDNIQLIYVLAFHGADLNFTSSSHDTLMHQACATGSIDTVKTLIGLGAAIDEKNNVEETPLYVAAGKKKLPVVNTLLDNGANLYTRDRKGRTLLHKAVMYGDLAAAESLIKAGVHIDSKAADGSTALYYAADEGHFHMTKLLLKHGADINAANYKGWTPLHRATQWGFENLAILLLNNGAKPYVTSQSGWSPLAIAKHFCHKEIENLIRRYLATDYPDIDIRLLSSADLLY